MAVVGMGLRSGPVLLDMKSLRLQETPELPRKGAQRLAGMSTRRLDAFEVDTAHTGT